MVGGTTGESPTLTEAELRELTQRACAQRAAGACRSSPVPGTSSTAGTVARARWLSQLPVDGLLLVTPAYNRPAAGRAVPALRGRRTGRGRLPVILYNVPARTAVDMLPATVARLRALPRIVGGQGGRGPRLRGSASCSPRARPGFVILSGDDATAREAIGAGARGVISVTANVAPRLMSEMVAAALAGDEARAQALDARLAACTGTCSSRRIRSR